MYPAPLAVCRAIGKKFLSISVNSDASVGHRGVVRSEMAVGNWMNGGSCCRSTARSKPANRPVINERVAMEMTRSERGLPRAFFPCSVLRPTRMVDQGKILVALLIFAGCRCDFKGCSKVACCRKVARNRVSTSRRLVKRRFPSQDSVRGRMPRLLDHIFNVRTTLYHDVRSEGHIQIRATYDYQEIGLEPAIGRGCRCASIARDGRRASSTKTLRVGTGTSLFLWKLLASNVFTSMVLSLEAQVFTQAFDLPLAGSRGGTAP